jgi:RNA polymerase sporulation-specific sigma factor
MRNKIRTATKQDVEIPVGDSNDIFENVVDSANPLEKVILSEHLNDVLSCCEETLSETEKAVVFFKAGGLSYEEIGEKLDMSAKSVDNALQRARKKLKNVCQDN